MRFIFTTVLIALNVSTHIWADDGPVRISIGGPRKVTASISSQDDGIVVTVDMIAVHCFDAARNKLINRAKAESYAKLALAKHLRGDNQETLSVSLRGKEITEARLVEKRFRLAMRVPQNGITIEKVPASDKSSSRTNSKSKIAAINLGGSVLTIKSDYLTTVESLALSLSEGLPAIPSKQSEQEPFFESIAKSEEEGAAAFSAIRLEMEADKLLLSIEKEEIASQINHSERDYIDLLHQQVLRWENQINK